MGNTSGFDSVIDTKWILWYNSQHGRRSTEPHKKSEKPHPSQSLDDWEATHNPDLTNQQTPQRTNDSNDHYQQRMTRIFVNEEDSYQPALSTNRQQQTSKSISDLSRKNKFDPNRITKEQL